MAKKIYNVLVHTFALFGIILICGFFIFKLGLGNSAADYFSHSRLLSENKQHDWISSSEYQLLKKILPEEKNILSDIETSTGVHSRLLISLVFAEQMRLFNSDNEIFKKIFEPLKILGVQSQFSWGILGLKPETLMKIETNLSSTTSPFYPGAKYEQMLDFPNAVDKDTERFNRVTDEHNHHYTYLYAALFVKEIEAQWENTGYDITGQPEILATLYNIGFEHSIPKADPKIGGATIRIGNKDYIFGELVQEFYNSNELVNEFPK